MAPRIDINLQLTGKVDAFVSEARAAEADGFAMVATADHPGSGPSSTAVLGSLAIATTSIKLCAYVINVGAREPLDIASEVATIDQLSGGRAMLGLGAGHTPAEWTMYGRRYPTPKERVDRLVEVVDVTRRLLDGETVTFDGVHIHTHAAALVRPRPINPSVPLLIGGGGRRVLQLAGRVGDVVSYSGLGRTLDDGHRHDVLWTQQHIDAAVDTIGTSARESSRPTPVIDILVQHNVVTDDRSKVLSEWVSGSGLPADVVEHSPFLLIGSVGQQVEQIYANHERWGISSYTVRNRSAGAALIAALNR